MDFRGNIIDYSLNHSQKPIVSVLNESRHLLLVCRLGRVDTMASVPSGTEIACDDDSVAVALRVAFWGSGVDADRFRYSPKSCTHTPLLARFVNPKSPPSKDWLNVVPLDDVRTEFVATLLPLVAVVTTSSTAYSSHPRSRTFKTLQIPFVLASQRAVRVPVDADEHATALAQLHYVVHPHHVESFKSFHDTVVLRVEGLFGCRVLEHYGEYRKLACNVRLARVGDIVHVPSGPDAGVYGVFGRSPDGMCDLRTAIMHPEQGVATYGPYVVIETKHLPKARRLWTTLPIFDMKTRQMAIFRGASDEHAMFYRGPEDRDADKQPPGCRAHSECPYFLANKTYVNRFGGCQGGGACQKPVHTTVNGIDRMVCYGCPVESSPFCCDAQGIQPDYAFFGDPIVRRNASKSLPIIDIKSLLPRNGYTCTSNALSSASTWGP